MILGIKTGLQPTSISDLSLTKAPFTELYFDIHRCDDYTDLFAYTNRNHIQTGLHYWGILADGTWTNLAYPDSQTIKETLKLIKKTIDIAARQHSVYVNIHPGCRARVQHDIYKQTFSCLSDPIELSQSQSLFLESALLLHEYANNRGVMLTIETVPLYVTNNYFRLPRNEQIPVNVYELSIDTIKLVYEHGLNIANDFGHTAASIVATSPQDVWNHLYDITTYLKDHTKLIHIGFIVPPYNGTDFHDSLSNPQFKSNTAIPNEPQLKKLFSLFINRSDIYALVEPNGSHKENYFLAKTLLDETMSTSKI